jgi:hypothetical protein
VATPLALATVRLVRLPSFAPCAFFAASAAIVRRDLRTIRQNFLLSDRNGFYFRTNRLSTRPRQALLTGVGFMNQWQDEKTTGAKPSDIKMMIAAAVILVTGIAVFQSYRRPTIDGILQSVSDELRVRHEEPR